MKYFIYFFYFVICYGICDHITIITQTTTKLAGKKVSLDWGRRETGVLEGLRSAVWKYAKRKSAT
uniref:Secreted protein n=1 Tax=Ascaris lumbricoides TaxID=6252 RepID=A0A0M3HXM5_ASCLU